MPRDSAGVYSLPPGYLAQTGQTILASQHNPPLEDLGSAVTGSLPRNGSAPMLADLSMGAHKITNVVAGSAGTDAVNRTQLIASAAPVGSLVDFAGDIIPVGWLLCYGQAVSRTTYAELFAVIGTTYGVGNGSTTFNVPDCRGRVIAGKDNMGGTDAARLSGVFGAVARALGGVLGAASHVLTISQIPVHNHGGSTTTDGNHAHTASNIIVNGAGGGSTVGGGILGVGAVATSTAGAHNHSIPVQGGGDAHPNAQPTIVFNKIIKTTNGG